MEPNEAAEKMRETLEDEREDRKVEDRFRSRVAIAIAILAALLAISSLGRDRAGNEVITADVVASDTWAFYQAKNIRQYDTKIASDALLAQIATTEARSLPTPDRRSRRPSTTTRRR